MKQRRRVAGLHHAPRLHQDGMIAQRPRFGEVVRHLQDGELPLIAQRTELASHSAPRPAVERGEWLIQQQDVRPGGERPGQRDDLALAAAQRCHGPVKQHIGAESLRHRLRESCLTRAVPHIARDVEMGEEEGVLVHHPDAALLRRVAADFPPAQQYATGAHASHPGKGFQQGGLPGARRTKKDSPLPAVEPEGDIDERERARRHVYAIRLDHGAPSRRGDASRSHRSITSGTSASSTSTAATGNTPSSPFVMNRS